MTNKLLSYLSPIIQVLTLILVIALLSGNSNLGGTTNYDALDVTDGISVDSTNVFDGSGNLSLTGSRTASVAGDVRLKVPVQTGTVTTIASSSVDTLTAAQVCDSSVIAKNSWDGVASSTAITNLPSAANMYADCLTTNGDSIQITFRNLHTTAGSSTAITAGVSSTLVGVDANSDIINGANEAMLEFIRYSATELIVVIREFTASD
mgnify:FL=1